MKLNNLCEGVCHMTSDCMHIKSTEKICFLVFNLKQCSKSVHFFYYCSVQILLGSHGMVRVLGMCWVQLKEIKWS